jgi:integrase
MAYSIHKKRTPRGDRYVLDYRDANRARCRPEFATRAEADDAAKRLVPTRAQRRQRVGADPRLTLGEWVAQWLATIAPPALKQRAYDVHARAMRLYLLPRLGDVRLVELRRGVILDALLDCQRRGGFDPKTRQPRPLKPGSVRTVYSAIRACLQAAVDRELLTANPAAKLGGKRGLRCEPTKQERIKRIKDKIRRADELATLTAYTEQHAAGWLPLLLVYARAGLRLGEGVALEVDDFSPAAGGSLRVRQAVDYITGKRLETPKNGFRSVDLSGSPELVRVLKAQVAGLKQHTKATGRIGRRWLFPTSTGGHLLPRNVHRKIGELGEAAGLAGGVSPQDLRHSYATVLLEAGASLVYVQQQLGHASIQITVDTYGATARPRLAAPLVGLFDRPAPPAGVHVSSGSIPPRAAKAGHRVDTSLLACRSGARVSD